MSESKPPSGIPILIESETAFNVYVNNTELGFTPWDIRFRFREIMDSQGTQPVIKNHGLVVMAPAHAKALAETLQNTIATYEEKFGEIDLSKIKAAITVAPTIPQ
jgi:hypothetical protein